MQLLIDNLVGMVWIERLNFCHVAIEIIKCQRSMNFHLKLGRMLEMEHNIIYEWWLSSDCVRRPRHPSQVRGRCIALVWPWRLTQLWVCGTETCVSMLIPQFLSTRRFAEWDYIAGSTGKRTWLGVQGRSEATVQIFKLCACPLTLGTQSAFSDIS